MISWYVHLLRVQGVKGIEVKHKVRRFLKDIVHDEVKVFFKIRLINLGFRFREKDVEHEIDVLDIEVVHIHFLVDQRFPFEITLNELGIELQEV